LTARPTILAACLIIPLLAVGLGRLRFDVEVLDLLPVDLPTVQGLRLYQQHFANTRELLITIEANNADTAEEQTESLAALLRQNPSLTTEVTGQPPWREHPEATAEFIAYLWLNQPPASLTPLLERLQPDALRQTFINARNDLATSLSPDVIARRSYDPLNLGQLPDADTSTPNRFDGGNEMFASPDGRLRLLFVQPGDRLQSYRDCAQWIQHLQSTVQRWQLTNTAAANLDLRFTGQPAFMAEIGGGMERDLVRSVSGMFVVIASLFWIAHRSWRPLLRILVTLILILLGTLAFGGLVFGRLNVVSAGFAAMLLGLAVDYGLVLYQEARLAPHRSARDLRRTLAPSIWWAALTTAGAFLAASLARLPGLVQMGLLVGGGILLAATTMLYLFLPWIQRTLQTQPTTESRPDSQSIPQAHSNPHTARRLTLVLLVIATTILLLRGWPHIDPTTHALRPTHSSAHAALEHLNARLGRTTEPVWLVLSAPNDSTMVDQLHHADQQLRMATARNELQAYTLPAAYWPHTEWQHANRLELLRQLPEPDALQQIAAEAGFTSDSLLLANRVFDAWRTTAQTTLPWWPTNRVTRWALDRFANRSTPPYHALGLLYPAPDTPLPDPLVHSLGPSHSTWLTSWEALGAVLIQHVKRDLLVVLPTVLLLLLTTLSLAFRRATEILLGLAGLAFSLLLLQATMQLAGWTWNLMNFVALPLLLGTGVDYSIHMQLALRRHQGNLSFIRRGVGRALLLCGTTTIAGFGSLVFSSNAGLASLGRLCATGMIFVVLTTVFLLPAWWLFFTRHASAHTPPPDRPSRLYRAEVWQAGLALVRLTPVPLLQTIACAAARLYWHLNPTRRQIVISNLLPLFPSQPKQARLHARHLYHQFALKLVDLWRFEAGQEIGHLFGDIRGEELFQTARQSNRGILLVTPHLGNWEFGGPLLAKHGIKLLALTLAEPHPPLTALRSNARAQHGIETLVIRQDPFAFLEVIRRLDQGEMVALLIDRPPAPVATSITLFGQPFPASIAPAEIARASGCIILPVGVLRTPNGRYEAIVLPHIPYDRHTLRHPDARRQLTAEIQRAFEPLIRQHADQWFHFVNIWPPVSPPHTPTPTAP
jgi:uncharacterized protein